MLGWFAGGLGGVVSGFSSGCLGVWMWLLMLCDSVCVLDGDFLSRTTGMRRRGMLLHSEDGFAFVYCCLCLSRRLCRGPLSFGSQRGSWLWR